MAFPATLADIRTSVIAKARLDATSDEDKVTDWINQIYSQVCVENEVLVVPGTTALTAGSATYDLSTATAIARIKNISVTSGGVIYAPLTQVSMEWILMQRRSAGGTATTQSTAQYYSLSGFKTLDLYPTPAAADTLTFVYVGFPTALSANGDVPVIQEPWGSKLLEYGALVEAADFKNDPGLARYEQKYQDWTARYIRHLNLRRGQPGAFEFFHMGEGLPPHDRATILPMT